MKWTMVALAIALFATVGCQAGAAKSPSPTTSPTAPTPAGSPALTTPAPTAERHPIPLDRIGEALINTSDLPGLASFWTQEDGNGGNIWDNGLCGNSAGPTPTSRVARRFVGDPSSAYPGWVIESILVFAPGDTTKFMDALRASADACNTELSTSGRALFRPRLPQIRNESQAFTVESFSCCVTPLPTDSQQPHEIVYIRDGDIVLHVYASVDVVEPAARHAEDRLDGVPIRPN